MSGRDLSSSADQPQLPRAVVDLTALMAVSQSCKLVMVMEMVSCWGINSRICWNCGHSWIWFCWSGVSLCQNWFQYWDSSSLTCCGSEVVIIWVRLYGGCNESGGSVSISSMSAPWTSTIVASWPLICTVLKRSHGTSSSDVTVIKPNCNGDFSLAVVVRCLSTV